MESFQIVGRRCAGSRIAAGLLGLVCLATTSGCFAPLCYSGIPACELDDSFRMPTRSTAARLNLANLALAPPKEYVLGPNDTLEVTVPDLLRRGEITPIRVQVSPAGEIQLPLIPAIKVAGMNLVQAQKALNDAYEGILVNPRAVVTLAQRATVDVVVLGEVQTPGHYPLNKYENDVAHAIAAAMGLNKDADFVVEVHRRGTVHRIDARKINSMPPQPAPAAEDGMAKNDGSRKIRSVQVSIASGFEPGKDRLTFDKQLGVKGHYDETRGILTLEGAASPEQYEAALRSVSYENTSEDLLDTARQVTFDVKVDEAPYEADVPTVPREASIVKIPLRNSEYTGVMAQGDVIKYPGDSLTPEDITLEQGDVVVVPRRAREVFWVVGQLNFNLSARFSLRQDDRDLGNGFNLPQDRDIDVVTAVAMAGYIVVDLIKARYDERETVLVQPGDVIYINPDWQWWSRRQWDRIFPNLFQVVSGNWVFRF